MESKLYIGNLAFSTTEAELKTLFSGAGRVTSVQVMKDHISGSSKGFAFLEMGSPAEMEKAVLLYNGYILNNRALKVSPARPRETTRPARGSFSGPRRGDSDRGRGQGGPGGGRDKVRNGQKRRD